MTVRARDPHLDRELMSAAATARTFGAGAESSWIEGAIVGAPLFGINPAATGLMLMRRRLAENAFLRERPQVGIMGTGAVGGGGAWDACVEEPLQERGSCDGQSTSKSDGHGTGRGGSAHREVMLDP